MMSHNVRLFVVMMTKVLYGMDFQSWGNIKFVLKLTSFDL